MTVPILFTFDDKLIMPACVCITSLLENALPETFHDIFIIHSDRFDFSSSPLTEIPRCYSNCRITFKPISGEFVGGYEIRGIPETCYYRLISPEIITEYDKILYSDIDVIFRSDLSEYYNIDLGDNCFAGVDNGSAYRPDVQEYISKKLGIDPRNGYYYSGNLIINLKTLREEKFCQQFRELGKNDYNQQDMDIMNIACNGRFLPLSPAFCLTIQLYHNIVNRREVVRQFFSDEELDKALAHGIIHYNGAKPWQTWTHHFDFWWHYYRKSVVYDEKFYYDFYNDKSDELDKLPLAKRIKVLLRFFLVGRKK